MMLVESDALDVDPGRGLVTHEALTNVSMGFVGYLCRNHLEMPHVVAGWSLMAVSAIAGTGRGVPVGRDAPGLRLMAGNTVLSHEAKMDILILVAGVAVQCGFLRSNAPVLRQHVRRNVEPREKFVNLPWQVFRVPVRDLLEPESSQLLVIHPAGLSRFLEMLGMTGRTGIDVTVKRRRLTLQQVPVIGVTQNALLVIGSRPGFVAGTAIVRDPGVTPRNRTGIDSGKPHFPGSTAGPFTQEQYRYRQNGEAPQDPATLPASHYNHLNPK